MSYLDGGPWLPENHTGRSDNFDLEMISGVERITRPLPDWRRRIVIDWGCGLGLYLDYFREFGARTFGIEPVDMGPDFEGGSQIVLDMAAEFLEPSVVGVGYLVMCLEVMEHIPRELHPIAMQNLCRSVSRWLVFSAATPGQGGEGHIAEMPEGYWFSHLRSLGLRHEESLTAELRAASSYPWFRSNISVWTRQMWPGNSSEGDIDKWLGKQP